MKEKVKSWPKSRRKGGGEWLMGAKRGKRALWQAQWAGHDEHRDASAWLEIGWPSPPWQNCSKSGVQGQVMILAHLLLKTSYCCCCSVTRSCLTLVTPWTGAQQAPLSSIISQNLFKFMSIESVMPSNHLILCRPLLLLSFPESDSFPASQLFTSGGQNIGASASASVLPMNIQGWFLLVLTHLISLLSKGLSRVFSSTTVWKHQFSGYSAL